MEPPTIETSRLVLRPFKDADIDTLVRVIMSDPEVMEGLPEEPKTLDEQISCAREYVDGFSSTWSTLGYGGWAICLGNNGQKPGALIGFLGFFDGELEGMGPEVAYGFGRCSWGKGLASEAAKAGVDWFFRKGGHDRCYASVYPFNKGSSRILKKIGFVLDRRQDLWGSVEKGHGLMLVYTLESRTYLQTQLGSS